VAYAYVAYQTAYLKAHFPLHFWAAMLSSEINSTDKLAAYVALLVSGGVRILGPDVNESKLAFTVDADAIRVGLAAVKGVGEGAAAAIIQARETAGAFKSLSHLLRSLGERAINRKVVECLVKAGAFDSLQSDRGTLLAGLDAQVEAATRQRQAIEVGQGFLFGLDEGEPPAPPTGPRLTPDELLQGERETLGFYLSGHPLDRWAVVLRELRATPVAQLQELVATGADRVTVGGLVSGVKIRATKEGRNQGKRMAVFNLEDQTGAVRAVAFSSAFERIERHLADGAAILLTASLRSQDGEHVELMAEEATRLEGIESRRAAALRIQIDLDRHPDPEFMESLHELLLRHEGRLPVRLRLVRGEWHADVAPTRVLGIDASTAVPALTALLGPGQVEYVFGNGNGS
jgi:DNA polymerase III subunit alpha